MEKNADQRLDPASLTKLMTAYLVFKKLKAGDIQLTDTVLISEKAWRMTGSKMYIEVGTRVSVELLLKGMIIQSGNDASVALAEFVAGTEDAFAALMTQEAKRLGLTNTHFTNSTGLPDEQHYSTAYDLVRLAHALIRDFPEYYHWYSELEFTYNNIKQGNRNVLLRRDPTVDGIKTGYTKAAGYCLIASAKREKMRLISVVMGAESKKKRHNDSEEMLNYGFHFFETHLLYQAQQVLDTERVWQGNKEQLQLGLEKPLYVTVPKGQYKELKATLYIDKHIMAPVVAGETYGTLKISFANQVILERPLVALSSVEEGNLWNRLIDSILLFFVKQL
jgi:D-alanyl-D-alanine carboxypeptidase (penicillin-binding protein 5/6)